MQTSLTTKLSTSDIELLKNIQQAIFPPRPRSFAALMEMYEINYMQLRLLCGDIRSLQGTYFSKQSTGIPLRLEVLEQSSHTTILLLTYDFNSDDQPRPDLQIQIYHDSRQANVISRRCKFLGDQINTRKMGADTQLLCQWRTNRFLFKWVKYLRRQNYSF
ncbi:DUF1249 domain-containing protein [Leucothrix pacifica]|uniref:DUF1249 domain-containing protein n=1 Tax=Leucothrix pacifica TaxID=1247513 RepID=A0A317C9A8_9GAMM|nr:DUF1249 domain-containing protein [Leucothrix pacifica]PWQ94937.1 DUF1249 domain-containing protein [Leucothrix pacifica]